MQPAHSPPYYPHLLPHTSNCSQGRNHKERWRKRMAERKPNQLLLLCPSPSQERWTQGGRVEEVELCPFLEIEVDWIQITSVCSHFYSSPPLPPPQYLSSPPPPPSSAGATPAPPGPGPPQGQRNRSGQGRPRAGADLHFLEAREVGEESPGKSL